MSERGAGRLIGDAAKTEVITFRCTPSEKRLLEDMRRIGGHASIGHYVRNISLSHARTITQTIKPDEE